MKNIINEFKGIVWPSKKKVQKEFCIIIVGTIAGILFISLANICITSIISFFI